jgi:hypothetical protein
MSESFPAAIPSNFTAAFFRSKDYHLYRVITLKSRCQSYKQKKAIQSAYADRNGLSLSSTTSSGEASRVPPDKSSTVSIKLILIAHYSRATSVKNPQDME